jgi:hypothetical protein
MSANGWLAYQVKDGALNALGVYPNEAKAQRDCELMAGAKLLGWKVMELRFVGWGDLSEKPRS